MMKLFRSGTSFWDLGFEIWDLQFYIKSSYLIIILLFFLGIDSSAQPARNDASVDPGGDMFTGKVINRDNRKVLPYAKIGVLHNNHGTCTNTKGRFNLDLSTVSDKDTLVCSHIGYKSDTVKVGVFRQQHQQGVAIFPLRATVLPPTNIMDFDDEMKSKLLGNYSYSKSKTTNFVSNALGTELGTTVQVKSETTYLIDLSFNIVQNHYENLTLRINLYYLYKEMPLDFINTEDIIVNVGSRVGKVVVDLLPYALIVDEAFFVSLEWVMEPGKEDNHELLFTGGSKSPHNYCRRASQDAWIQYKGFGPAIGVTGVYE